MACRERVPCINIFAGWGLISLIISFVYSVIAKYNDCTPQLRTLVRYFAPELEIKIIIERIMEFSIIVWLCMASFVVVLATVKCIHAWVNRLRVSNKAPYKAQGRSRYVKLLEIGSEREEIWIPGDLPMSQQYDDDAVE